MPVQKTSCPTVSVTDVAPAVLPFFQPFFSRTIFIPKNWIFKFIIFKIYKKEIYKYDLFWELQKYVKAYKNIKLQSEQDTNRSASDI